MKKKILFGLGAIAVIAMLVFSVNTNGFVSSEDTSISEMIGISRADAEGGEQYYCVCCTGSGGSCSGSTKVGGVPRKEGYSSDCTQFCR